MKQFDVGREARGDDGHVLVGLVAARPRVGLLSGGLGAEAGACDNANARPVRTTSAMAIAGVEVAAPEILVHQSTHARGGCDAAGADASTLCGDVAQNRAR